MENVLTDGQYVDEVFQQLTADFLNRQIISYSVIVNEGDEDRVVISPREHSTDEPFHLLLYADRNFISPHYQSIRRLESTVQSGNTNNLQQPVSQPPPSSQPNVSEEEPLERLDNFPLPNNNQSTIVLVSSTIDSLPLDSRDSLDSEMMPPPICESSVKRGKKAGQKRKKCNAEIVPETQNSTDISSSQIFPHSQESYNISPTNIRPRGSKRSRKPVKYTK